MKTGHKALNRSSGIGKDKTQGAGQTKSRALLCLHTGPACSTPPRRAAGSLIWTLPLPAAAGCVQKKSVFYYKYCQCQAADREEGPHPASRYGPFVRTGQPVSLGSVYGNARLRPASVLRGRAARTITLLSGIASGVLPAPPLLRSCPDGSS